ncbi:MAG: hypothetical protein EGR79_06340 [Ruminococcaceae bacterium]|nr:hypothetical protein [Oscillospiraceae bacterium]
MDKYIETLDALMKAKKEKKRKEPTIKEKEAFRSAWLSLVADTGLAGRAEQFLYEGFAFCGAEPFYAYLIQTEDQNATLATMFSGKYYGIDSNVSFRLVTHLLALMLNNNAPGNILAPIIKRLPGACVNKDKKRLGTAEKTLEKYFLAELRPDAELCPLADIGTKPVFINEFVALVSSIMDGIENAGSTKGVVVKNIAKIRKWFADYDISQSVSADTKTDQVIPEATKITEEKANTISVADNSQEEKVQTPRVVVAQPEEKVPSDMIAYLTELLGKAAKVTTVVKAESTQQRVKIDALTQALEGEQNKLQGANQQISDLQDTITELRKKLSAAEGDIFALRQAVAQRDAEIAERVKMAEVLSRDRNKQADELLQKLASKIRIEYRDFVDALDVPMSCDLGENLRLQLQSIFDILEKGGMKIK